MDADRPVEPWLDLGNAEAFADERLWQYLAWLRAHRPVAWHDETAGPGFWAVTKYDDIRTISRNPHLYSSYERGAMIDEADAASLEIQRMLMLNMDPPQHTRLRLLVNHGFTPTLAERLRGTIDQLVYSTVDNIAAIGSSDVARDVSRPLTAGVLAELLGVSRGDAHHLYELADIMQASSPTTAATPERSTVVDKILDYSRTVAELKRRTPDNDVATALLHACVAGDRLSNEEFSWFVLLLLAASGDTVRNLLTASLRLLASNPAQRALLADNLDTLLPTAIEEILRYAPPVIHFRRTALHDTSIRGQRINAGDKIVMLYLSANRDEDVFPDADRFDIARHPNPHVAFGGGGPHLCLGMHLARLEASAMLRELLTRLPDTHPH